MMRSVAPAAALLATLWAAHRHLRGSAVRVDVTAPLSDPRTGAAVATSSIERYPGYTIAIVEFDDQGRFWDRRQVTALEAEIAREAGLPDQTPVSMFGFGHRWREKPRRFDKALGALPPRRLRNSIDH